MKKYLMTGIAALAMIAGFTSCSSNDDAFDYEGNAALTVKTYQENFIKVFGKPAANQTWGFGAPATRAINVNGNLWAETPECTKAEAELVYNYVNMTKAQMRTAGHIFTETFPRNIENYFVTQVWSGTDPYSTWDGNSTGIVGGQHMDHLCIAMQDDAKLVNGALTGAETSWAHINNFNASSNMNYGGNTLVVDGGTKDFVYLCSEDSRYHNKWIAVNGADVDPSLAGKYYICFDFIAENPDAYTNFKFKIPGNNSGEWIEKGPIKVPGCWTVEEAIAAGLQISFTEHIYWPQDDDVTYTYTVGQEGTTGWMTEVPVGGNKVIPANDVYTDWIVRIVEAQPAGDPKIRVFAEDLSASEKSDFDFNDVVFDVEYVSASNVKVTIRAAGGTLPLYVADNEVHDALVSVNRSLSNSAAAWDKANNTWLEGLDIDVKTMINTNARRVKPELPYKAADNLTPYEFNFTGYNNWSNDIDEFSRQVRDHIKVTVEKDGNSIELTANMGEPACKVAVPINKTWSQEKVSLGEGFARYVTDPTYDWCNPNN